jgi:hypothetical protein
MYLVCEGAACCSQLPKLMWRSPQIHRWLLGRKGAHGHITTPLLTLLYDLCILCHTISLYHQGNILQKHAKAVDFHIRVCLKMSKP